MTLASPILVALGCAAALVGLGAGPAIANAAEPAGGPGSLAGVWFNSKFSRNRDDNLPTELPRTRNTADGRPIPFQPWARAEVDKRLKSYAEGHPFAKMSARCLPGGVPQMMQPPPQLPIEIVETPGQVTILFESLTTFRIIHMNETHPEDPDPTFMGNSVGRWDGDTLVVDTIGLKDITTVDDLIPHSEALHVVERLRRTGPDTMEDLATVEDPKVFTAPYTYRFTFKRVPGEKVREFLCENNRNAPDETGATTAKLLSSAK
jgi:hypothetical protein